MSLVNLESSIIRDSIKSSRESALPEKALEVLEAARRVIDRDGADGLTLRAVAQEAGVPSSLAIYYFGSMAKLEALLLDSIWRDEVSQHLRDLEDPPLPLVDRVDMLVNFHSTIAKNIDGFRTYSELITHVIRDDATKQHVARIYEGYRSELNFPLVVSEEHSSLRSQANAAMMLAAGEGLPLNRLLGGSEESMLNGFSLLSDLFKAELLGKHSVERYRFSDFSDDSFTSESSSIELSTELNLNATSRRLLSAGIDLLHIGGLREITFGNISELSGESKSLISYYFKSKHGFLDALVRVLLQEWTEKVKSALINRRLITPVLMARKLFGEKSVLVSLILLQPALRHELTRREMAQSAYTQTIFSLSTLFSYDRQATCGHSAMTAATVFLAALNGLALQSIYDPKGFDLIAALQSLLRILPPTTRDSKFDLG